MPAYEFQVFEGMPSPTLALSRVAYYRYQTCGDYWEHSSEWEDDLEPFEVKSAL